MFSATINEVFKKVTKNSAKSIELAGKLIEEIGTASKMLADGIEYVDKALVEMDKVVYEYTVNTEESAASVEKMNTYAEQMKGIRDDFVKLVGGSEKMSKVHPIKKFDTSKDGSHKAFSGTYISLFSGSSQGRILVYNLYPNYRMLSGSKLLKFYKSKKLTLRI